MPTAKSVKQFFYNIATATRALKLVSKLVNEKVVSSNVSEFFNKVKLLDENLAKQSQSTQVLVNKFGR